jgi:hypothetical protein
MVVFSCWIAGSALLAAQEPGPTACGAPIPAGQLSFQGITYERDAVRFMGPRTALRLDGVSVPVAWVLDGQPVAATALEGPWQSGPHELVATAPDGCGVQTRVAEARFTVDDQAPALTWRVVRVEDLEGKTPDRGREKRYLWWWLQPERKRLVWTDGVSNWAVVRRFPGTIVEAAAGRPTMYAWAPDGNPFDQPDGENALQADRVLVLEGSDETSGIGGMRLAVVEDRTSPEAERRWRDKDRPIRLVASAVDRAGNSVSVDLPYRR